jgi:hypothetical protein
LSHSSAQYPALPAVADNAPNQCGSLPATDATETSAFLAAALEFSKLVKINRAPLLTG